MKKSKWILLGFIFLFRVLSAQNLLDNGSFESFYGCPAIYGLYVQSLDSVVDWYNPCHISFPSIHHNKCGINPPGWGLVPKSHTGWQQPRTGESYIDQLLLINHNSWIPSDSFQISKSFAGVELTDTMIANKTYKIRLFISLAEFPWGRNPNALPSLSIIFDSLGFYLSNTKDTIIGNTLGSILSQRIFEPQVYDTSGYYNDTCHWVAVTVKYTANGGEKYMIFGNFQLYKIPFLNIFTTNLTSLLLPTPTNNFSIGMASRYYIDDVAIWPADTVPPPADAGPDTTICRGGKARLGTHSYADYIYEWWPAATLSNDSGGVVWASPDTTTTYYLQATDDIYTKTLDSVTVFVNNCGQRDTVVCVEQPFVMGSTNNPLWIYQWSPSTWLNSDTVGMPLCSPMSSQNYQLLITNAAGDTIALDSTHLITGSCFYAEAGNDSLICKGDSLQIGKQNYSFVDYAWSPNFMISDTAIGNPVVWPDTTTWYFLQLIDTLGNVSYDSVLVDVQVCIGMPTSTPLSRQVRVYPNPASHTLNIELKNPAKTINFVLTDVLSHEIKRQRLIKINNQLNISNLPKGIYLWFVEENGVKTASGKVVVK